METYKVQAYTDNGQVRMLVVTAASTRDAYTKVKAWGYTPGKIMKEWPLKTFLLKPFRSLRQEDLVLILRQMAYSLQGGYSLGDVLRALETDKQASRPTRLLGDLQEGLHQGKSFSKALEASGMDLPYEVIQWAKIGEQQGRLDAALFEVADILDQKDALKKKVRQSLAYPSLVLAMTFAVALFLLFFVLPILADTYLDLAGSLPWYMPLLLGGRVVLLVGLLLVGFALVLLLLENKGVLPLKISPWIWDIGGCLPWLKDIRAWSYYVPFSKAFAGLLGAGVPLDSCINLLQGQAGPRAYKKDLACAGIKLSQGQSIPQALASCRFIPGSAWGLIRLGDKTGQLPQTLALSADMVEAKLSYRLDGLAKLLEPMAILILGGVVFLVALTFFLPLLDSYNLYVR